MSPRVALIVIAFGLTAGCVKRPVPLPEVIEDLAPARDLRPPPDDLTAKQGIGDPCQSSGAGNGELDQGTCPLADQLCVPEEYGFPEGYCVQRCDDTTPCPTGSSCIDVGDGDQVCFLDCKSSQGCRDGYLCDPDDHVCYPEGGEEGEVTPGTADGGACVTPIVEPVAGRFGANQLLSLADDFAAEVQLAVDPLSKHVVVAWINFSKIDDGIAFATSVDDGVTFSMPTYLPKNDGISASTIASDPVVAVDASGAFYITWIGYDQEGFDATNMNVFVARSDDGGLTFEKVIRASPATEWEKGGIDKPWISVDPADGSIWSTWQVTNNNTGDSKIRLARSVDKGATWTTPVTVNDARSQFYRNLAMVHHDAAGRGYVVWTEIVADALGDTENRVYLQAFSADGTKDGANVLVSAGLDSPTFEDASVVAAGDQVYVGFISGNASGAWDVRVAKSDDSGATFTASVKVNDDVSCATHFHHTLAIGSDGRVHALWFDNRYLVGNVFYAAATSAASDPLVFSANSFVTDSSFEFTTSRSSDLWLGDYLGLAIRDTSLYAAWTDPRSGLASIRFAKGAVP